MPELEIAKCFTTFLRAFLTGENECFSPDFVDLDSLDISSLGTVEEKVVLGRISVVGSGSCMAK